MGREGNFRAAGFFFRYQIPCMNFFRPQHEYFLGLIGVQKFFSFNFPLREYFFLYFARPPSPPSKKFSNGPSLSEGKKAPLSIITSMVSKSLLRQSAATIQQEAKLFAPTNSQFMQLIVNRVKINIESFKVMCTWKGPISFCNLFVWGYLVVVRSNLNWRLKPTAITKTKQKLQNGAKIPGIPALKTL